MAKHLDVDTLLKALDNEDNASLMDLNYKEISDQKRSILGNIGLSGRAASSMLSKLKSYRYVDGAHDLQYGRYIRWIPLRNPDNIKLTNGGIVCEIKVEGDGIQVVCKNNMNRMFQLSLSQNLVFQRLTDQEQVLLSALQYLST